ncbi:MAG: GntR family transcriptional regulator [Pseudomonadota bacterium]
MPAGQDQRRAAQAYEIIRAEIISLAMPPGSTITENTVSSRLGFSRTPVREALIRLSDEGLVEIKPQLGTKISLIDPASAFEALLIRRELEKLLAQRAAGKLDANLKKRFRDNLAAQRAAAKARDNDAFFQADDAFHRLIAVGAGLKRVPLVIDFAAVDLSRIRNMGIHVPGHTKTTIGEHVEIFSALEKGGAKEAQHSISRHLRSVFCSFEQLWTRNPDWFVPGFDWTSQEF